MSALASLPVADLVRRIVEGAPPAEDELVARFGRTLRFLAGRYMRDAAAAEDLYQETLLVALEKIRRGELRDPDKAGAFLRALAKNLSVGHYRRRSHAAEETSDTLDQAADLRGADPLGGLLERERARRTRQVLADLDVPRDRAILFRYYFGEESSDVICRDLDITPEHFYRVLSRARQRYLRLWQQEASA